MVVLIKSQTSKFSLNSTYLRLNILELSREHGREIEQPFSCRLKNRWSMIYINTINIYFKRGLLVDITRLSSVCTTEFAFNNSSSD